MKVLPQVSPTPEQMPILADQRPGFHVIRGAAGSGKTTTALLRLHYLCLNRMNRRERLGLSAPVRVMVLTYNRTLQGDIEELANQQVRARQGLQLNVSTFSKWAYHHLGEPEMLGGKASRAMISQLAGSLHPDSAFLADEVDYVLGRLREDQLHLYPTIRRDGRGASPRMERPLRERLLTEVIRPYEQEKIRRGILDWNDVSKRASAVSGEPWDIVVIDEAQDFSANQVRAVVRHLADDFTATFVLDATQRIYPRYFSWPEAGVTSPHFRKLLRNYRNTRQIAAFALPIVAGLPADDDGALPDFSTCTKDGPIPVVLVGKYSRQVAAAVHYIRRNIDLSSQSVAFLHPLGGGWFDTLKQSLKYEQIQYCEITRESIWPRGPEAVALSTLYSAKGLEFDHIFILGLNQEVTPHGMEPGDSKLDTLQRLLAMGISRGRSTVHLGYKPGEASTIVSLLDPRTYSSVAV